MKAPAVLVIRKDDPFSALLRKSGCRVLSLELTKTEPVEDLSEMHARFEQFGKYDGLFFTSPTAAEVFKAQAADVSLGFRGKVYVLGGRARRVLEDTGLDLVYRSSANTAEELLETLSETEFAGKRFLFVRGDKSLRTIPEILNGKAAIDEVIVYRTVETRTDESVVESLNEQFEKGEIDWVCFFSPSGVESFRKLFGANINKAINIAVIGTTTAKKAMEAGLKPQFVSQRANAEDFAVEFIEHIKKF